MNEVVAVIHATSPADRQEQLDKAVAAAQEQSTSHQRVGIMVTRYGYRQFTVELDSAIAFGDIRERDASFASDWSQPTVNK